MPGSADGYPARGSPVPWIRHGLYRASVLRAIDGSVQVLPAWFTHASCVPFTALIWRLARRDRAASLANLARIRPPGTPEAELRRLSHRLFLNFAHSLVDTHRARHLGRQAILDGLVARFEGHEHIERALAGGRGMVLITAHVGNWELGGALFAVRGLDARFVAAAEPDARVAELRRPLPGLFGIERVVLGRSPLASLPLLAALRSNSVVIAPGDRCFGPGIDVQLFGAPARLPVGPYLLARSAGAPIVPAIVPRMADGRYQPQAWPALALAASGDPAADVRAAAAQFARFLEEQVGRFPDQWFNFFPVWEAGRASPEWGSRRRPAPAGRGHGA